MRGCCQCTPPGFPLVSGESIIGAVTIALEQRLIEGVEDEVRIDTPVGLFRARPKLGAPGAPVAPGALGALGARGAVGSRVTGVEVTGVPSFVHSAGLPLRIGTRNVTVDIAFGGEFYAIADSEVIGIPIDMAHAAALTRMGREITDAVESAIHVQHPLDGKLRDVQGTIFTGAARAEADVRSATVLDGEVLRRSPGATGTAALMAVLDAMGLLTDRLQFTHEGLIGTTLRGSVATRRQSDGMPSIIPIIEGSASVTGFHEFVS